MSQDLQFVIVIGIVAVAFWVIGQRLWGQILAFRSRPQRRRPSQSPRRPVSPPPPVPLIQLQLKPPAHLKRPPPEN